MVPVVLAAATIAAVEAIVVEAIVVLTVNTTPAVGRAPSLFTEIMVGLE